MVGHAEQRSRCPTPVPPCRPSKVIFADEISTGLDSSTTFQIVQGFSNFAHMRKVPALRALSASLLSCCVFCSASEQACGRAFR